MCFPSVSRCTAMQVAQIGMLGDTHAQVNLTWGWRQIVQTSGSISLLCKVDLVACFTFLREDNKSLSKKFTSHKHCYCLFQHSYSRNFNSA